MHRVVTMAADKAAEKTGGLPIGGGEVPSLAFALPGLSVSNGFRRIGPIDHLFILRALILHSIRFKYRANPFGLVMEYFRLIVVIGAHYLLFWSRNKQMPADIPIETFVIAAFSVWYAFRDAYNGAERGWKSPGGTTLVPGITEMHMRLAKGAWAFLSALFFSLIATVVLNLWGDPLDYPDVSLTTTVLLLASAMGFGFGLVVEALTHRWQFFDMVAHILIWLLFVTSGIYFSISDKQPIMATFFWYNPVLHLTEYQRHSFDPGYPIALVTLLYPAACAAALLLVGLALNRSLRYQARE